MMLDRQEWLCSLLVVACASLVPGAAQAQQTPSASYRDKVFPDRYSDSVKIQVSGGPVFAGRGEPGAWLGAGTELNFEVPIFLRADVDPVILSRRGRSNEYLGFASALAGYEHRVFRVGIGPALGWFRYVSYRPRGVRAGIALEAMFGQPEGLHLGVRYIRTIGHDNAYFALLDVRLIPPVPLSNGRYLRLQGGLGAYGIPGGFETAFWRYTLSASVDRADRAIVGLRLNKAIVVSSEDDYLGGTALELLVSYRWL